MVCAPQDRQPVLSFAPQLSKNDFGVTAELKINAPLVCLDVACQAKRHRVSGYP